MHAGILSLTGPEEIVAIEYIWLQCLSKKTRHYPGSVPGMKRKAKAMGTTQSSDSASRRSVVSDAVQSTSLSQEDVRVVFLHDFE